MLFLFETGSGFFYQMKEVSICWYVHLVNTEIFCIK